MKKFWFIIAFFITSSLFTGLLGCAPAGAPGDEPSVGSSLVQPSEGGNRVSAVRFYDIPDGVTQYDNAEVWVAGERMPLYSVMINTSQTWTANGYNRVSNGVGLFELDGMATVVVKPDVQINYKSKLRPLSANIIPVANLEENTLTFTLRSAGEYVLEINGDTNNTICLFVSDYETEGEAGGTADGGYTDEIVFSAGLHTAANDKYISSDNTVRLSSNTRVVLEDGAVVRAKFLAENKSHIAIEGRGIIDGSAFERDAEKGTATVPIDFNYCTDVTLKDFSVLDPAGWCVNFYFIDNAAIEDLKIITSRSNGDGISLQSCKNVTVDGCFLRTWDDTLVVKNYPRWDNRDVHGETRNVVFKNCTLWTDLAQSMEIGYETVGKVLENVAFENITVLHALNYAAISIHNANNAEIKDITFKNITIEDAAAPSVGSGIIDVRNLFSQNWSEIHTVTALGSIENVTIDNVKIISARRLYVVAGGCRDVRAGYESVHYVNGLKLSNISVAGVQPTYDECKISSTGYLEGLSFTQDGEVTGAEFIFSRSEDYLKQFGTQCRVEFVKA